MTRLYDVTDRAIKAIAEGSPALQQLNLGGVIQVTEMGLYHLAVNCVHLHTLNVDGCEKVTVKGLGNMIRGRKFVERSPDFFGYVPIRVRCKNTDWLVSLLLTSCPRFAVLDR